MFERHDAQSDRAAAELNRDQPRIHTLRLLTDREVPLSSAPTASVGDTPLGDMPVVVQQWLDGDIAERIARRADDNSVELWNRIAAETSRRSRVETPALMADRIMAVLPKKAPSPAAALLRPFGVRPVTAIVCALALIAGGVAAGEWLLH